MGKRIVIALGGNALGNNLPEQMNRGEENCFRNRRSDRGRQRSCNRTRKWTAGRHDPERKSELTRSNRKNTFRVRCLYAWL